MISKIDAIKTALSAKYEIRFNTTIGKSQYRIHGTDEWLDVDSDMMKEFKKELRENGTRITDAELRAALEKKNFSRKRDTSDYEEIEMYIQTVMETRFNVIKQKPEYRYFDSDEFEPVNKYFVNSLNRQIAALGIKTSVNKLNEILFSDFSPEVNPVSDFFTNMDEYNIAVHGDAIAQLADSVEVVNKDKWYEYLKKWLVACVANALIEHRCANHTMLVLTGSQGKFKTTWLDNLCPPGLETYHFSGKINVENKDTQTLLAECFLINVDDQLKQMNKKDENEIKNMITVNNVKYRRPYDVFIQEYPHLASFCGSVNGNEFLTDPTGSRRFLPFEVKEISLEKMKAVDMYNVWNQAYSLYKSGMRYWFTSDEVDELNRTNELFQVVSMEEQFLLQYFESPVNRQEAAHDMQPAEILSYLQNFSRTNLRMKTLGEAMQKHGYEKWRKTIRGVQLNVYSVIKKSQDQVQDEMKAKDDYSDTEYFSYQTNKDLINSPF